MKNIVITRGVFGYVPTPGAPVIAKTPKDPPFSVEDALAARLVAAEVAAYEDAADADTDQDTTTGDAEYNEGMTRDELNKIAESYGIEAPAKIKGGKAAVIKAIEAAKTKATEGGTTEDDEGGDTGDQPPAPGLADPV